MHLSKARTAPFRDACAKEFRARRDNDYLKSCRGEQGCDSTTKKYFDRTRPVESIIRPALSLSQSGISWSAHKPSFNCSVANAHSKH